MNVKAYNLCVILIFYLYFLKASYYTNSFWVDLGYFKHLPNVFSAKMTKFRSSKQDITAFFTNSSMSTFHKDIFSLMFHTNNTFVYTLFSRKSFKAVFSAWSKGFVVIMINHDRIRSLKNPFNREKQKRRLSFKEFRSLIVLPFFIIIRVILFSCINKAMDQKVSK